MKAAYYSDVGLEQMVPDQMWIEEDCKYDIVAMYGISPVKMDTQETDKNKAKKDKTKHKVEKIEKDEVNRSRKSKVKAHGQQKSTPGKSKSTPTKPKQKNEDNIT
nr:hypothetical protein [Tanacetum cinerariifolium]